MQDALKRVPSLLAVSKAKAGLRFHPAAMKGLSLPRRRADISLSEKETEKHAGASPDSPPHERHFITGSTALLQAFWEHPALDVGATTDYSVHLSTPQDCGRASVLMRGSRLFMA